MQKGKNYSGQIITTADGIKVAIAYVWEKESYLHAKVWSRVLSDKNFSMSLAAELYSPSNGKCIHTFVTNCENLRELRKRAEQADFSAIAEATASNDWEALQRIVNA